MPIYEFVCQECGHEFERILPFSTSDFPPCPRCQAQAVKRRVGLPAIHFKGSGWYITDSRKDRNGAGGEDAKNKKESGTKESSTSSSTSED